MLPVRFCSSPCVPSAYCMRALPIRSNLGRMTQTYKTVGRNIVGGRAWDANGDGVMSVDELWTFMSNTNQLNPLGQTVWNLWNARIPQGGCDGASASLSKGTLLQLRPE